jgi:hypothetical protein
VPAAATRWCSAVASPARGGDWPGSCIASWSCSGCCCASRASPSSRHAPWRRATSRCAGSKPLPGSLRPRGLRGGVRPGRRWWRYGGPSPRILEAGVIVSRSRRRSWRAASVAKQNGWQPEDADERLQVRLELVDLLLARGERARALSELLLVATYLPPEPDINVRVGRMFFVAPSGPSAECSPRTLRGKPRPPPGCQPRPGQSGRRCDYDRRDPRSP